MGSKRWADVEDKVSPERRAEIDREVDAELERMGYAALRKARELTQVEMAERLGINQASVSALETRTDLQLSTLAKYIRAMGGELEIRAVFPEAVFNLESPAVVVVPEPPQMVTRGPSRAANKLAADLSKPAKTTRGEGSGAAKNLPAELSKPVKRVRRTHAA